MRKYFSILTALMVLLAGCKKFTFDNEIKGEAIQAFKLTAPAPNATITLNSGTPNSPIVFSWTAAQPGINIQPTYRVIMALRTGSIDQPIIELVSDNNGKATQLTITQKQLDDLLALRGIAAGASAPLMWSVVAYNGTTQQRSADVNNVTIRRMANGASPFTLLAPAYSTSPVTINPGSTTDNLTFRWTKSSPGAGSPAVKYTVLFAERKLDPNGNELPVDWSAPLFRLTPGNSGADTFVNVSYKALSDTLTAKGFTNLSTPVMLKWTVVANSGTWNQQASVENVLGILREVKMYIVGSATPGGWDISKSLRMIEDRRFPGTFYMYVYLTNGELKFVNGQQWPPAAGAMDYGQKKGAPAGELAEQDEDNISVATAGVYRVTVDLTNMKYYLQTAVANGIGGMGMIGGFQGWSQPAVKMDYVSVNRFNYLVNMNNGDEFKFHDGNEWVNSAPNKSRWFGLSGTTMGEDNGSYGNFKYTGTSGLVRAIWDATDVTNMRYTLIPGKLYAIGGDANLGNWNNSAGNTSMPEFTYLGNGKWTATITVSSAAQFKLVVEQGNWDIQWGQGSTPGTMTMRYYDADPPAFQFPAAGTYTVLVDEYNATISW